MYIFMYIFMYMHTYIFYVQFDYVRFSFLMSQAKRLQSIFKQLVYPIKTLSLIYSIVIFCKVLLDKWTVKNGLKPLCPILCAGHWPIFSPAVDWKIYQIFNEPLYDYYLNKFDSSVLMFSWKKHKFHFYNLWTYNV